MCGIYGIVLNTNENIYEMIINGLIQLQNRGYDSAGLCILKDGLFDVHKYASTEDMDAIQKLTNLKLSLTSKKDENNLCIGMGHNRWATHGIKNDINSHPHLSNSRKFSIVHNGIIENYNDLKNKLVNEGFVFFSQTDTEVIVNLIEYHYLKINDVFEAILKTTQELQGTYGVIVLNLDEPNKVFCLRKGSPLLIGKNNDMVIITSEQSGFSNMKGEYISLNNNDICVIEKCEHKINIHTEQKYSMKQINTTQTNLTPFPYDHWTLKEIHEQPQVILNSINNGGRIKNDSEVKLGGLERCAHVLKDANNIIILGCGTSYFAGIYGMYFFKQLCNFNTVQVFDGADFSDYDIPKLGNTVFILISQSGETLDLHRCIEIAKRNNIVSIGIINVVDSLISREVDCGIYCNAGKEVGVASTKAFTSQVVCLSLVALWFSKLHNVNEAKRNQIINDLKSLSIDIQKTIDCCKEQIIQIAKKLNTEHMFLIGKGSDECIAKEGSLKVKEISYIHSEAYSSSSLKHGPFALLSEKFPVIILNLDQMHYTKTLNCYQEIKSRNAPIIFITNDLEHTTHDMNENIIIPKNMSYASLLGNIPIQLLAYYLSIHKNLNPDKPRNLAKVVTVE
jgi:glucosamine--fructose-6-phosphate aminotransferase (isomerizing)